MQQAQPMGGQVPPGMGAPQQQTPNLDRFRAIQGQQQMGPAPNMRMPQQQMPRPQMPMPQQAPQPGFGAQMRPGMGGGMQQPGMGPNLQRFQMMQQQRGMYR
jgi:hypothetical protein